MAALPSVLREVQEGARHLQQHYKEYVQKREASLDGLLKLAQLLQAKNARLAELDLSVARLEAEVAPLTGAVAEGGAAPDPPPEQAAAGPREAVRAGLERKARTVSFAHGEDQRHFSVSSPASSMPLHGHWLPAEATEQRLSFQDESAKQLGGRKVTLQTSEELLGPVDCILVEPMGKVLSPADYVGTGLVIGLYGAPPAEEVLEEWGQVLRQTKLLDAGMSVLLPDLQMSATVRRPDVEALVEVALAYMRASRCVILGKSWGAGLAVELATADSSLVEAGRLVGLVLAAPAVEAPEACSHVAVPVLTLSGRGDAEAQDWARALRQQGRAPAVWRQSAASGQDVGRLLRKDKEVAHAVLHFTSAVLLLADLAPLAAGPEVAPELEVMNSMHGAPQLPDHSLRLCEELPGYLEERLAEDRAATGQGLAATMASTCAELGTRSASTRLSCLLQRWLRSNMQPLGSTSSASAATSLHRTATAPMPAAVRATE